MQPGRYNAAAMGSLNSSKLFGGLLTGELLDLDQTAEFRHYPAGASIFREGDPGDGLYVIVEGTVQIVCRVGQDERRVLSTLGPGEFFGEMAVLDEQTRSATALAETEVRARFVPREDLLKALEGNPRLAVRLVKEFSLRLRDFNHRYTMEVLQAERLTLVGRFARTIVHDFKNPLNIVGISADMAAMDNATLEMRQTCRTRIRRQVERMSNMISELLEFTRSSGSTVVLGRMDYAEFVNSLLDELRSETELKGAELILESEPPRIRLLLDPVRLGHVFHNILNNACDAMPQGGKIYLRFREEPEKVVTEIEDSGPGISPEIAPRLFEAFATYGKSRGTGLGLSICKRIVQDHSGRIAAANSTRGGAVFSFSLPVRREQAAAERG
ncbi:MAG: cyclic nucleotide-binding domain-containing protein [Verrucomicrobia bacterium]|nr:cyclic nucleotide-binding domain-containing protein [Verrucomicrobiota bacterium]